MRILLFKRTTAFGLLFFFPETLFPLKGGPRGAWNLMEQPQASGTPARLFATVERPQGYFVLFVGRRYYLRPILSPSYYPLERAKRNWNGPPGFWNAPWRNWNGPWPMERPPASGTEPLALPGTPQGVSKNHYYTRATHGIVEVMWSNRGAFVERGFLFVVLKCRMRCKITTFF